MRALIFAHIRRAREQTSLHVPRQLRDRTIEYIRLWVRGADARLVSPLFPLEMDGRTPVPTTHRSHRPCHSQPTKRRAPLAHERREDCRILAVTRNTSWRTAYIIGRNNRSRVREHRDKIGCSRTPWNSTFNAIHHSAKFLIRTEREREREIY